MSAAAAPAAPLPRPGDPEITPALVAEHGIAIGVVATPAAAAQEVADLLVAAGVTSILNFAPAVLSVADAVSLRKVDLATELQILSFYQQRAAHA